MKVKQVLVDLYRLFVSREAGRKKKKARGAQWEGEERRFLFPSSPALFLWIPSGSLCVGKRVTMHST